VQRYIRHCTYTNRSCMHVCMYVCVCAFLCVGVCVSTCACGCVGVCVCVCVCLSMCVCVSVCSRARMRVRICIYIHMCLQPVDYPLARRLHISAFLRYFLNIECGEDKHTSAHDMSYSITWMAMFALHQPPRTVQPIICWVNARADPKEHACCIFKCQRFCSSCSVDILALHIHNRNYCSCSLLITLYGSST